MTLPERVLALHRALAKARLPHAFGGALALAYWTQDPRGTSDIDVNVFIPSEQGGRALRKLPEGIVAPADAEDTVAREGQIRLWWDETPIDLFFNYADVHDEAARHRRTVPFAGTRIPILGPIELAVFKVMFDRTRDWADIEAMLAAGTLDLDAVGSRLQTLLDADDHRFARLGDAVTLAAESTLGSHPGGRGFESP